MYQIKIVSDQEFEALPGKNMEGKVGVAYPHKQEAYIRQSGVGTLDAFNIAHELEHLDGKSLGERYDSENGCYYKGFGDVLSTIVPMALSFIPGAGPALGMAASAGMRGYQASRARRGQRQQMGQMQDPGMSMPGGDFGGGMQGPEAPNIVTPTSGRSGLGAPQEGGGGGTMERIRGFFSGRNPISEGGLG